MQLSGGGWRGRLWGMTGGEGMRRMIWLVAGVIVAAGGAPRETELEGGLEVTGG